MYDIIQAIERAREAALEAQATVNLDTGDHALVQVRQDDLERLIAAAELKVCG